MEPAGDTFELSNSYLHNIGGTSHYQKGEKKKGVEKFFFSTTHDWSYYK